MVSGSIHSEVPVKPVCPKLPMGKSSPRLPECGESTSQPRPRRMGWDVDSPHSGNRGELFPIGSFGHTGFTGTSLWIDPLTKTYVILLANSVHPDLRPALTPVRAKVATIVAANVGLRGQRVTLSEYNQTGYNQTGYNESLTGPGARRQVGRNG